MIDKDALSRWYDHLAGLPCLACHSRRNVEVAHVLGLPMEYQAGVVLHSLLPRSHKTISAFVAIPLCATCHREGEHSIHAVGEAAFFERNNLGRALVLGFILKHYLLFSQ